jgi:hypothetical protein
MNSEYQLRLDDIRQGPWRRQSQKARELLPRLSASKQDRYFRSHYVDEIEDAQELEFRESFDQALEELQLLELAVASGYLPLSEIQSAAKAELETLLRSDAARKYLQTYDFLPVRHLAARVGVELGLPAVHPPRVQSDAALRYATFLAVHSDFTSSVTISKFTMLMDDYCFHNTIDARFFERYLAGAVDGLTEAEERILDELRTGMVQFVQTLGDLFLQLRDEEKAIYGCVYAYWLGRFFGIRRVEDRYETQGVAFDKVAPAALIPSSDVRDDIGQVETQRLADRVASLREVWDRTRTLTESYQKVDTTGERPKRRI